MNAPGKNHRNGISLFDLFELFPDEESAREWFESKRWPDGVRCARCNSNIVYKVKSAKPMPWRCSDCKQYFSVKMGTFMGDSKVSLRKWAIAIYLVATSLKGVSSMKLHRDLKVTQKTAWFMAHRIREAMEADGGLLDGPIEIDETYVGGRYETMHADRRKTEPKKTVVAGVKDRATGEVRASVIDGPTKKALLHVIWKNARPESWVLTDEHASYQDLEDFGFKHRSVQHGARQYVKGPFHTNGIESFWSMLKRGFVGTFHHWSAKHTQRYANEFACRATMRDLDTIDIMGEIVKRSVGRRLTYQELKGA